MIHKLKKYQKELGLCLVEIPTATKGPVRRGWQKGKGVSYKKWSNGLEGYNAGVLHHQSKTICLDIDNLTEARSRYPMIDKIVAESLNGKCGLVWSSGVENRLKILFKMRSGSKLWKKMRLLTLPGGIGQIRGGKKCGLQDVIAGIHPSGSEYNEINCADIEGLYVPKWFEKALLIELSATKKKYGNISDSGSGYTFIDVYNKWYMDNGGDLLEDIFVWSNGGYERVSGRMFALRRVGSSNKLSVQLYQDSDGIDRVMNFSDHVADDMHFSKSSKRGPVLDDLCDIGSGSGSVRLLPQGVLDPYGLLVLTMGYDEARRYVCSENEELALLVDNASAYASSSSSVNIGTGTGTEKGTCMSLYRKKGIILEDSKAPYLSDSIKFPEKLCPGFSALVKSMCWHQQGVYNPDMAFWYSLVFGDWLIGGGYNSIGGTDCEPLYVFTAGPSGMGKTVTMKAGNIHIRELGGSGRMVSGFGSGSDSDFMGSGGAGLEKKDEVKASSVSVAFRNKRHIKNVKTAEGLEDMLTSGSGFEAGGLDHGCDVLFTQDEYGLRDGGGMDSASRLFRATILDYKTLSRLDHIEPRLLAKSGAGTSGGGGGGKGSGGGIKKVNRYCVHFNYFTTATNETLKGVIGDSEVGSGYLQRFIGGTGSVGIRTRKSVYGSAFWTKSNLGSNSGRGRGSGKEGGVELVRLLRKILKHSNKVVGLDRVKGGKPVKITDSAREYLDTLFEVCLEVVDSEPLVGKMVENMLPLCKLIAIFRCPGKPVVGLEDVKWAHTIVSCSSLYFKWLLGELRSEKSAAELRVRVYDKVVKWIEKKRLDKSWMKEMSAGKIHYRDFVKRCGVVNVAKAGVYNPVLSEMIRDKVFYVEEIEANISGRVIRLFKLYD